MTPHTKGNSRLSQLLRFGLCVLFLGMTFSCTRILIRRGNKAKAAGEYNRLRIISRKLSQRLQGEQALEWRLNAANSYMKLGQYQRAAIWYERVYRTDSSDTKLLLKLGDCYLASNSLDKAEQYFRLYVEKDSLTEEANRGFASIKLHRSYKDATYRYSMDKVPRINSFKGDYAAVFRRPYEIFFTSMRKTNLGGKRKSRITGQVAGDIYYSVYDNRINSWGRPLPIDEEGNINTEADEGTPCFNSKATEVYFTRAESLPFAEKGSAIFHSKLLNGKWQEAKKLPLGTDSTVSFAHPSLSQDGQRLFFCSDQEGGFGGFDIWYVERAGSDWGEPINAGNKINTAGDELYPFIRDNNELYFSSNYHAGLGGFDVFRAVDSGNDKVISHLEPPLNSPQDDIAIYFVPNEERGLITSSRNGRYDNIYLFGKEEVLFYFLGEVRDAATEKPAQKTFARVVGNDGSNLRIPVKTDGVFQVRLVPDVDYLITAYKKDYLLDKVRISTNGLTRSKTFRSTFVLRPTDKPVTINNIYYKFGKSDLDSTSLTALRGLAKILIDNPGIRIELRSHTDYVGHAESNIELSQKRAESVARMLIGWGIAADRLVAKGYGETTPREINAKTAAKYSFLSPNQVLTEEFIRRLPADAQRIANSLNRRTEIKVLINRYDR